MSEHPNATVARDSYEALAKGDLNRISELLTDDVVFHVPGRGPLAGDYRGKDEVLRYLGKMTEVTDSKLRFEPDSYLAGEDHAAVLLHIKGERDGREIDDQGVHVFRISSGKISERWSYPQDSYVVDEFFA
ncbi:nuclear transport factor 2 family protein [Sphaerisporangium sp. TRM90804]|uniref:nuclear transport factor 2 family protein n=1 Tax=Sphaerisporangium sp. TRM90804 TaxID=3031113 RepID=UPI0024482E41|nr:nuclear transport factor 2 family protein [Sphaerisporangium sp. TRM90804]MDH2429389.1 nuclear transport factor 2 family protein [Sphaerisporangium sp. TRM90804]